VGQTKRIEITDILDMESRNIVEVPDQIGTPVTGADDPNLYNIPHLFLLDLNIRANY